MARAERFISGAALTYTYLFVVAVAGLWLTPFLLSHLGPSEYGLWLVAAQLMTYVALLDFGAVALLPREVAYATGRAGDRDNAPDVASVVDRTGVVVLAQLPIVLVAAGLTWWLLPTRWESLESPLIVLLTTFVVLFPLRLFRALLEGLQDLAFLGVVQICGWVVGTVLTVGMVLQGWGLYSLAWGLAVAQFIPLAAALVRVKRRFPGSLPARLSMHGWDRVRRHFVGGLWVSVGQVAQVLLYGVDVVVIASFLGPAAAVPYSCTAKLVMVLAHHPQVLASSASPALAELRMGAERSRLDHVTSALTLSMLLISGGIAAVILAVNEGFVTWWVGAENFGGGLLTALLIMSMVLRHWNATSTYALFCFGYERRVSLTALCDGLVTVMASILLIRSFGLIGAPLGSIIGVVVVSLPANLRKLSEELGCTRSDLIRRLTPWLGRAFFALGFGVAAGAVLTPSTTIMLVVVTSTVALLYLLLMFPVALGPPVGMYLRPRLSALVGRLGLSWVVAAEPNR